MFMLLFLVFLTLISVAAFWASYNYLGPFLIERLSQRALRAVLVYTAIAIMVILAALLAVLARSQWGTGPGHPAPARPGQVATGAA